MEKFSLIGIVVNMAGRLKPVLVKLVPIELLRRVKKHIINFKMDRLDSEVNIQEFSRKANPDGINLIGYIQGEIGLGQSCRLIAQTLKNLENDGIPFTIYNYEQVSAIRSNDSSWAHKITNNVPYNINIIHINPYELPLAFIRMGNQIWDKRYNIAFWLWELEVFPKEWEGAFRLVDEIWTPSEFASQSIRKSTDKPVYTVPYALFVPDCGEYKRESFNLPEDKILFLCVYDCNSTMERKNPIGVIRAYKKAFPKEAEHVGLVIKMNNQQQQDIRRIKKELNGYRNVYLITNVLDKVKVNALIACVDVYVSLHRAEGFGLVPTEAMLLGTPVIATNWSANTEFMNGEVACMVNYKFIEIDEDYGPYTVGNRWAEPDLNQAAEFMLKLCKDEEFRIEISKKAKVHIKNQFAPDRTARLIKRRIKEIYK